MPPTTSAPITSPIAPPDTPLQALERVLSSIDAVRNARALYLLLATTAGAGLLLWVARRALVGRADAAALLAALATFAVSFYGSNATGIVLMDEACGRVPREPAQALRDAFARGHRLLLVAAGVLLPVLAAAAGLGLLLWLAKQPVLGATIGQALIMIVVPLGVPLLGAAALVLLGVVAPLAAPAVWSGMPVRDVFRLLAREVRGRALHVLMLSTAASLLSAAVAALVSFALLAGGRALLALAAVIAGLDLQPQAFLAALFGRAGAPAASPEAAAAVTGAGVVFALGLALPGVVYLRGLCAVFLAVHRAADTP